MMKLLLVLFAVLGVVSAKTSYHGFKTYRITSRKEADVSFLKDFEKTFDGIIDVWNHPHTISGDFDFMAPPFIQDTVESLMERKNIQYKVMFEDVQAFIDKTSSTQESTYKAGILATFDYNVYHTNDEINQWMNDFKDANPTLVEIEEGIGLTFEGREIRALKIGNQAIEGKQSIWYQGGIHAREWISPATMLNLANYFVEDYKANNAEVKTFLDTYDIFIVPVLNQDGYIFTWTTDRMWRKNRNTKLASSPRCYGVDLNRNYDYEFGGDGANNVTCSGLYHGPSPLSEPETGSTAAWLKARQDSHGVPMFIDFHSYGQFWMWPWGYAVGLPDTKDHDDQEACCLQVQTVIEYDLTCQRSALMYAAAGASEDFGYGSLKAKYSYIIELPDLGEYGFLLPESQINYIGATIYNSVKVAINYMMTYPEMAQ